MEGFDEQSVEIVLNIIHGKGRKVPRKIDLHLLVDIAILVDDLECYEEMEMVADLWIDSLSPNWSMDGQIPRSPGLLSVLPFAGQKFTVWPLEVQSCLLSTRSHPWLHLRASKSAVSSMVSI